MRQTRQNRIQSFAFIIGICAAVCFSCGFASNLELNESASHKYKVELNDRINPNYAPVESLVRLPGLGPGRAGAIVAYRKSFQAQGSEGTPFENCNDLQKVKGIGPKTAQNLSEWLKFD